MLLINVVGLDSNSLQGIMFNIGVFMGWSDLNRTGNVPWEILGPIYIGACCWTVTYETVYQHQVGIPHSFRYTYPLNIR
jgi:hypothetical protein